MQIGFFGAGVGGMVHSKAGEVVAFAEALGYHSLWTGEHMVLPNERPEYLKNAHPADWAFGDPLIMLSYLAGHTTKIRLCTGVLNLPQRNPIHLAKELSTLDIISNGRIVAGVGLGNIDGEILAMGLDKKSLPARLVENIHVMKALWQREDAFQGTYINYSDMNAYPYPLTPGGPPIVMGGNSPAALRRAARYADGWYGWGQTPEIATQVIAELKEEAKKFDRNLDSFEVSITPLVRMSSKLIVDYEKAGVDQLILVTEAGDLDGVRKRLEKNAPGNFGL